jgi:hypothetical protein
MRRPRALFFVALAVAAASSIFAWCRTRDSVNPSESAADVEARVRAACGNCHPFPTPDILPRPAWRDMIQHMVSLRKILREESFSRGFSVDEVAEWYESRALDELPVEFRLSRNEPGPLRFSRGLIRLGPESGPGVATVQRLESGLIPGVDPMLAAPNMANGSIHLFNPQWGARRIGAVEHPARVVSGDLDGDGLPDLVISDLGDPMPSDELVGRLVVGINGGDGEFALETALDRIGRVADARPVDLDADGDLDIVVAAFGWLRSGGIYLLDNRTRPGGPLDFRVERVSQRSGAVSVLPVERLGVGPGRGFAVAFSQHYELVSVFYEKDGRYEERVIYRAPHPNWGVSNLAAVDLDGDSDVDFLLAHGDTLDDGLPFKFYHGVEWLENRGNAEFRAHRIGSLYGAHSVEAADLDGDGDLDIVATSFLPQVLLPVPKGKILIDSVVWFEHTEREWIPWAIEFNHPRHTSMTVVDVNRDGRLDIVAAINRAWDFEKREHGPSLETWINEGPR